MSDKSDPKLNIQNWSESSEENNLKQEKVHILPQNSWLMDKEICKLKTCYGQGGRKTLRKK